eukprot:jgi/Picre1/30952/NNA_006311.t1
MKRRRALLRVVGFGVVGIYACFMAYMLWVIRWIPCRIKLTSDSDAHKSAFPEEWKDEVFRTFEHVDGLGNQSISSQGIENAFNKLQHGIFVRIEDGKMYMHVWKHAHGYVPWRVDLQRGIPPIELCRIYDIACSGRLNKDIDFVVNCADEPVGTLGMRCPVMSWVKTRTNTDLLLPYKSFHDLPDEAPEDCDYWSDIEDVWDEKKDTAVWRGSTTSPYVRLVTERKLEISGFVQSTVKAKQDIIKELGEKKAMPMSEQLTQHKFAIVLDGNSAPSSRIRTHLESLSLMIKQESPFMEFFYTSLHAYTHYVPLSRSLQDVKEAVEFSRDNDLAARLMVYEGRRFACRYFNRKVISEYVAFVFEEYAKRFEGIKASSIKTSLLIPVTFSGVEHPGEVCPGLPRSCPFFDS